MDPDTHIVPRLEDLELRPIVTVRPDSTLQAAASVMRAHNISSVVVSRPGDPVSVLTERDMTRAVAEGWKPGLPVEMLSTPHPLTLEADATAMDAATLMLREGIRHLVVTRAGRAAGVVSTRDLLSVLVRTVTPETVFLMVERVEWDTPSPRRFGGPADPGRAGATA